MAKRGGGSGRKYVRDSIGRFASKGFSGQTGGRGARLKAKGKKRDGGGAIVKPSRIGEMKNTISKSSSKRKVNASSRATDRQIARDVAARSKPTSARTSKGPTNKAKVAYKRASGDARMRNADLRGADAKERRMANSASAKVKNMQRRRSASTPKAGADAPRSKQKARELARVKRASSNERKAYAARGDGAGTAKQSRSASVAKRAQDIYSGKISASKKTTSRLTRTQNPDVLRARIKKGEKLTAARAKKKSVTANSARATGKLTRPVAQGNIRRTGGRLGPKNTIKPGPKSPRTKMNRAIDNVIKKGKALKGSADKLRGVKKQADALRGRMLKEDKGRLGKALSKPSVTDKRSRDYGGRLTKGARGQDPATGGKKGKAKPAAAKPAAAKTKLKRSGQKIRVNSLATNKEQGRKGIASMSSRAKAARKGDVAERKSGRMSRIAERQSEIVARRQGRRASNYNPDGTFNQSTANANQRRLGRSKQLQEKLRSAGGGKNIASKALSKGRKPAAAKPAAAKRRGAVGKISEAKAGRIVARMDAQRGRKALPGRRNANFVRTAERRSQFILKPAATARNKGKAISVNESVQKAVSNAAKRRKPKRRRS